MAARVCTPIMTLSVLDAVIPLWPPCCIFEPINNKMNESMFLHAGEGIKIVERYIVTVKVLIRTPGAIMWRGRGRIRAPIWARREPISSVADWRIVRNAWACGMEASASSSAHEQTVRLYHWQIV